MNNLTTTEKKVINNLSKALKSSVQLGDLLQLVIASLSEAGTPANAVVASEVLTVSGVVLHGETITFNNPAKPGIDVYEFLADAAQKKRVSTNIAVDITDSTTASTGTLTMDTQPIAGDKVTIGAKVFTFVPVGTDTADGEISIGVDVAAAQAAFVAAINGTDGVNDPHPLVSAGAFAANASVITALIGGVAGDAIATTETFTAATNVFAAVTLGTGADCTAANAITALVAAITAYDTQDIIAADGAGDTVTLTSAIAGAIGNDITLAATMTNGSFTDDATEMSGGVDGTVSSGVKIMVDETNLYICFLPNTKNDRNWRRVELRSLN